MAKTPTRKVSKKPSKKPGKRTGKKQRVGLYPGTFDPITNGHLDIIERAAKLVDKLIIGVGINTGKGPAFSTEERVAMVERETRAIARRTGIKIEARPFQGLLVQYAREVGAEVVIRGLRAVADFEYEFQMVGMNRRMDPGIEIVFLMAEAKHQAIASKLVKEIVLLGGDVKDFVPATVARQLKSRLAKK